MPTASLLCCASCGAAATESCGVVVDCACGCRKMVRSADPSEQVEQIVSALRKAERETAARIVALVQGRERRLRDAAHEALLALRRAPESVQVAHAIRALEEVLA